MTPRPTDSRSLSTLQIGLIAIVLTVIGFYLAFTKSIPFTGEGYTLKAVFTDAQSMRVDSPVRVSGVDVGEVTAVEHVSDGDGDGEDAALVTMRIDDEGRPVKEDAILQLRPRLFLEGNLFVDMNPGTPGAEELDSGSVIPLEQTSISVQFDQVLTSLQAPVREKLQLFLKEFGTALCGVNPPRGACEKVSGGEGFRESFRTSPAAYSSTAQVNEALLGTQPGDLAGFVRNLGGTFEALNRNQEQLKDLVTNFRIFTGSFAAESDSLELAIQELPGVLSEGEPALAKLNAAFPQLRAFAREALPGTRAANTALTHANPWIGQARQLVSKPELRGLVKDLRPTIPSLARLTKETLPFLEESRALANCFVQVIVPWGNMDVPAAPLPGLPDPAGQVYKETGYGLTGVSGESRSGDAQGQWFRVLGSGGPNTIAFESPELSDLPLGNTLGANLTFPLIGAQPALNSSAKTPFRPDQPCENQDPPNLESPVGAVPASEPRGGASSRSASGGLSESDFEALQLIRDVMEISSLEQSGQQEEAGDIRDSVLDRLGELGIKPKELPGIQRQLEGILGQPVPVPGAGGSSLLPGVGANTQLPGVGN
ncbi:MAG: MlaD family protein [Solirubrobacterales bacterium]